MLRTRTFKRNGKKLTIIYNPNSISATISDNTVTLVYTAFTGGTVGISAKGYTTVHISTTTAMLYYYGFTQEHYHDFPNSGSADITLSNDCIYINSSYKNTLTLTFS